MINLKATLREPEVTLLSCEEQLKRDRNPLRTSLGG